MLRGIGHLFNRHKGQTVWICGTGPSLDRVADGQLFGQPRILINRAAFVLPAEFGMSYWFVQDDAWGKQIPGPWGSTLRAIQGEQSHLVGVFRSPLIGNGNKTPAPRGRDCYLWHGDKSPSALKYPREMVTRANTLYQCVGTGSPAAHLAWLMGASRVVLAGLDGGGGYAMRLAPYYTQPSRPGIAYRAAREDLLITLEKLQLPYEDLSA